MLSWRYSLLGWLCFILIYKSMNLSASAVSGHTSLVSSLSRWLGCSWEQSESCVHHTGVGFLTVCNVRCFVFDWLIVSLIDSWKPFCSTSSMFQAKSIFDEFLILTPLMAGEYFSMLCWATRLSCLLNLLKSSFAVCWTIICHIKCCSSFLDLFDSLL